MNEHHPPLQPTGGLTLVLGATGKTGRRVAARLQALGQPLRSGSRQASPAFDWTKATSWDDCLAGVTAVYVNYPSDLPVPGSRKAIAAFVNQAIQHGVRRLVLLTGRGETEAQAWEDIVQESGLDWTIIRASWFCQNFSEGAFAELVQAGQLVLPAGDIPEPFVDLDDIADVAVAALTQPGHGGQVYEVTGPRLLTFAQAAAELSQAIARPIEYQQISLDAFLAEVAAAGLPQHEVWMLEHLFGTVLDGRNAQLTDGVQRALGRPPKDFTDFARDFANTQSTNPESANPTTWRNAA